MNNLRRGNDPATVQARALARDVKRQKKAEASATRKRQIEAGDRHSTAHRISLVVGVAILLGLVGWFALGQYVDAFRLCTSTMKDKVETTKCSPVPSVAVAPGLILAALFISPYFDEIDIAGIGRVKRKQKALEQDVIDVRGAAITAAVAGSTQPSPDLSPSPANPDQGSETPEEHAVRLWNKYLEPARIFGGFATHGSFVDRATLFLGGNQDVDLTPQEREVLDRVRRADMVRLDRLSKWAFQKRQVLEMLAKQIADLREGKLSQERAREACDAVKRLTREVLEEAKPSS